MCSGTVTILFSSSEVGVGKGVAVGSGVRVGVGTGVAVGSGVGVGVGTGADVAAGTGVTVGGMDDVVGESSVSGLSVGVSVVGTGVAIVVGADVV